MYIPEDIQLILNQFKMKKPNLMIVFTIAIMAVVSCNNADKSNHSHDSHANDANIEKHSEGDGHDHTTTDTLSPAE